MDHVTLVVWVRFLYCKITNPPFKINKNLVRRYFEAV